MAKTFTRFERGSEWRRWDLHVHTKGTAKNDNFVSKSFDEFCVTFFKKAFTEKVYAVGITDYFNIENYKQVLDFVARIDGMSDLTPEEKTFIKEMLILPNVELRMLPVTDKGRLVNIHCIFNPNFVRDIDNDFFNEIKMSSSGKKYQMNKTGLISLGKNIDSSLDDEGAHKKGLSTFVVSQDSLQSLLDTNKNFRDNTLIIVSNSNNDGASAFQKHYDLFEKADVSSLDGVRKFIYEISQVIFSSNDKDRNYFIGKGGTDDPKTVVSKCGSLKPCIHGSDAHTEEKLFKPDEDNFCWIKADLTFDGLKQIVYEPEDRVFVGQIPPILSHVEGKKTKYIESLKIDQKSGYTEANGVWFKDVHIQLNKELVAIIGNKGSGKSAIADVIGLAGNTHNDKYFSFLQTKKFLSKGYAENYHCELIWCDSTSSGQVGLNSKTDHSKGERVRYLPQSYFEWLTNDLEDTGFNQTLKSVTFSHLPTKEKLGKETFDELVEEKNKSINSELISLKSKLKDSSSELIKLEEKLNPSYKIRIESDIEEKERELKQHLADKPSEVLNPSKDDGSEQAKDTEKKRQNLSKLGQELETINSSILNIETEVGSLMIEKQELTNLHDELERFKNDIDAYIKNNGAKFTKFDIKISDVLSIDIKPELIKTKIKTREKLISDKELLLMSSTEVDSSTIIKEEDKVSVKNASLLIKKKEIEDGVSAIKKQLSEPERKYQEYQEKLKRWDNRKKEIEGSKTIPGSKKFLEEELRYINVDLKSDIINKRSERIGKVKDIYCKKKEIVDLYNLLKKSVDERITGEGDFSYKFKMDVEAGFRLDSNFASDFLNHINKTKSGTYCRAEKKVVTDLFVDKSLLSVDDVMQFLNQTIDSLWEDMRADVTENKDRYIGDQINDLSKFYDFLFSLEYLEPVYELKLDGKTLDELSPGEKGALLLVFYLMVDSEEIPLVIDQPEDNLDNKSVFEVLTHFIKNAKKHRQIIIVTHNPNLAVGADAEQIIYVDIDKKGNHEFSYLLGSIENQVLNEKMVEILEGTMPAFDKRKLKYQPESIV